MEVGGMCMPLTLTTLETRQEESKFKTSLGNFNRPCFKTKKRLGCIAKTDNNNKLINSLRTPIKATIIF